MLRLKFVGRIVTVIFFLRKAHSVADNMLTLRPLGRKVDGYLTVNQVYVGSTPTLATMAR